MTAGLWLTGILVVSVGPLRADQVTPASPAPGAETCEAMSRQLFEAPPTPLAGRIKEPKGLHYVKPEYPDVPTGTVGSGVWVGEALIGPDGRVRTVSVLHDLKFTPPFPEFSKATSDAILKWRYAPTTVDGKAVPVCMTISVNIYWR